MSHPAHAENPATRETLQGFHLREAGDGVRTRDPQLGKLMLYQLSYTRDGGKLAHGERPINASPRSTAYLSR
jgi:hypothetical protein